MKHKEIKRKVTNRAAGLAQGGDRFAAKQLAEKAAMKKKRERLRKRKK